jgi:RNase adapter protein RapZ
MSAPGGGPRFVILSGLSGAGKTQALDVFEDAGYFCIDNLPPQLVPTLVDLLRREGSKVERVAVVCDARGGEYFGQLNSMVGELRERDVDYRLVFLEASDEALVRRFKETRRRHPLAADGSVLDAIRAERGLLAGVREEASLIIDTADLSLQELRAMLRDQMISEGRRASIVFAFVSFGYKYGIPLDADLLFDVRFLPNPYWEQELRPLSGLEAPVRDYVLKSPGTAEYFARLLPLLDFLFPRYAEEGKAHLTIGIGCTGGKHRSVTIAEYLAEHYRKQGSYTIVRHRDLARE